MTDLTKRLNLIQRAVQRNALSNGPAVVNGSGVKQTNGQPQGLLRPQPNSIEQPPLAPLDVQPQPSTWEAEPVRLDYEQLHASRIATPDDKRSATYNEFRSIKRKLLTMTRDADTGAMTRNVVMVTSALPREGKTFTVMNLAICLAAERNLDVILVDGDVIRSSVDHYFHGEGRDGLVELLTERRPRLDDVLHPCADLPGLHVLFAGKQNQTAPELLASPRMTDICSALSRRFPQGIVLFDTPPVLAASESAALTAHANHLIMLVSSGQAARNQVEAALTEVSSCPSISLLFNRSPEWQRPLSTPAYYYGYGQEESEEA